MFDTSDYDPTQELAEARTLPSRWYRDPALFALEHEKIFTQTWQWVGRAEDVRAPGDFFTCDVGPEPLLVVRNEEGDLQALSNVCRHRAGPVAAGKGRGRQSFQCGYHGWTYRLDGRLHRAPEMEGVSSFRREDVCLPSYPVVAWGPLIFARLRAAGPSLEEVLGNIPEEVERAGFPVAEMKLRERRDYLVDANWKVYVDNYLEGYHIPLVHPALFREVDYERYRVDTFEHHSSQYAPLRAGSADRVYPRGEDEEKALYYWLFPNLMLNFYPENLQVNRVVPLDAGRTLTVFEWYAVESLPERKLQNAIAFSDQVQREDKAICEVIHKGLGSSSYDQGRLSVRRENGVHHFHRLLHASLTAESA